MERNTHQKLMVLETVRKMENQHPTATKIYEDIKMTAPSTSLATVYRILNSFVAQGVVKRIPIPSGADRFDSTLYQHYHMRCNLCGKVKDVDIPIIENVGFELDKASDDVITGYDVIFNGVCSECVSTSKDK